MIAFEGNSLARKVRIKVFIFPYLCLLSIKPSCNWRENLPYCTKNPSVEYLFLESHEILRKSIALKLLGIYLITFLIHLLQFLLCLPPKQDGVRNVNREKVYCFSDKQSRRTNLINHSYFFSLLIV